MEVSVGVGVVECQLYPRDGMLARVLAVVVRPCVCLCVCHTPILHQIGLQADFFAHRCIKDSVYSLGPRSTELGRGRGESMLGERVSLALFVIIVRQVRVDHF